MIIILIIILSFITRPKLKYIKEICNALNKMARGDLKYKNKRKGKR